MNQNDIKQVLWENVSRLMRLRYGKENLTRLADESGAGPGSITRIKNQDTSVGLDTLEKIAGALKVSSWALICPDMKAPTEEVGSDFGRLLQARFDSLPEDLEIRAACLTAALAAISSADLQIRAQRTASPAHSETARTSP